MSASLASPDRPAPFASARGILLRAAEAFRPPLRVPVADYAAAHRWVVNPGGGYTGRWSHDEAPYLVGPMNALTSRLYTTTCLVGPGQCGKTEVPHNWLLQSVGTDPADFLWYMQTDRVMRDHVKDRIDRLITDHETLRAAIGTRPSDSTQEYKRFTNGMAVHFMVAAQSNMISKRAPRIVVDEPDNYDPAIRDKFFTQIDVRRTTFGRDSMILGLSHPDRAVGLNPTGWTTGIMALYRASTRGVWYWACPHCGGHSSPNPGTKWHMPLHYPADAPLDAIRAETRLICPHNGCLIEDHERRAMNIAAYANHGGWIHEGQDIDEEGRVSGEPIRVDTAGFWIVAPMSTLAMGGIGALAASRVEAERAVEAANDDAAIGNLKDVFTKKWGIPYLPPRGAAQLDADAIADRAEPDLARGIVPDGARFLTAFFDVQGNRFEVLVRAWGEAGESWIIDHLVIAADPSTEPNDWDAIIARLTAARYPLATDPARGMALRAIGFDSAGGPGVTQQAYAAWNRARQGNKTRLLGKISGREAWSLIPTKGSSTPNAPRLQTVRPDSQHKDRKAAARGIVPLAMFNANTFKDDLNGQLQRANPGNWFAHFPAWLRAEKPPHPFFAGLLAETRKPNGVWVHDTAIRNEPVDLMVGTHVVAHLHGMSRIDWRRPPAWASAWETNPMIAPIDPAAALVNDLKAATDATPAPKAIAAPALPQQAVTPTPDGPRVIVAPATHNSALRRFRTVA